MKYFLLISLAIGVVGSLFLYNQNHKEFQISNNDELNDDENEVDTVEFEYEEN